MKDYGNRIFRSDLANLKDEFERVKIEIGYLTEVVENCRREINTMEHTFDKVIVAYMRTVDEYIQKNPK